MIGKFQIQSDIFAQLTDYMGVVQKYQISHWLARTLGIITDSKNLSTDADRRTDTILKRLRDLSKKNFKKNWGGQ